MHHHPSDTRGEFTGAPGTCVGLGLPPILANGITPQQLPSGWRCRASGGKQVDICSGQRPGVSASGGRLCHGFLLAHLHARKPEAGDSASH